MSRWLTKDTLPMELASELESIETFCIDNNLASRREIKQEFLRIYQKNQSFIKFSDAIEIVKIRYVDKLKARLSKAEYSDDTFLSILSAARLFDRVIFWVRTGCKPDAVNANSGYFQSKTTMSDSQGLAGLYRNIFEIATGSCDRDILFINECKLANLDEDTLCKLSEVQRIINKHMIQADVATDYVNAIPSGKTVFIPNALRNAIEIYFKKWQIEIDKAVDPLRNNFGLCKLALQEYLKAIQ